MAYPTGELTVDLHAVAANWRSIQSRLAQDVACGAVVKANAYGLGVDRIAPRIYAAGCRHFFVANIKEALQLRSLVGLDAKIFVLSGVNAGAEEECVKRGIIPVIVSLEMLSRWHHYAKQHPKSEAVLKVNSGMGRLGLEPDEIYALVKTAGYLKEAGIKYLMSHLACAEDKTHPLNNTQLERFDVLRRAFADADLNVKSTLSNSAGVFLGETVHCDIVRPGIALYGGNPGVSENPMQSVVGLRLPVIQIRRLPPGESVGYGATCRFAEERFIAVASGGYADGIMRALSNKGWGYAHGQKVPIVGRISMDSTTFDVTDLVHQHGGEGISFIELLGEHVSIDDLAQAAGTISYEILTSIGSRYQRSYIE